MKVIDVFEKIERICSYLDLLGTSIELGDELREEISDLLREYKDMLGNLDVKGGPR